MTGDSHMPRKGRISRNKFATFPSIISSNSLISTWITTSLRIFGSLPFLLFFILSKHTTIFTINTTGTLLRSFVLQIYRCRCLSSLITPSFLSWILQLWINGTQSLLLVITSQLMAFFLFKNLGCFTL